MDYLLSFSSGALRPRSSFRRYASMFLVKSKDHTVRFAPTFFVPELGALFLVQKSDENSSLFRHFVSRFFVRAELIKDADSFRILSEVNDVSTSYKDLHVWQLSMDYVMEIYRLTRDFPEYEKYGLGSQLQRSAVSIPSNIAEGSGRQHRKEFIQFLYLARGSLLESLTQLAIANRLGYINDSCLESIEAVGTKINMMINKLISSLKKPGL